MKLLFFLMITVFPQLAHAGFDGKLNIKGSEVTDFSRFIVWVENGKSLPKKGRTSKTFDMDQRNKDFRPKMLVIRTGDKVRFDNKDTIFHNVFSLSPGNKFDLGVFKGEQRFSDDFSKKMKGKFDPVKKFDKAGKVQVFCNIHQDMYGVIYVFDHGHYAIPNKNGKFLLPLLPKGKHRFAVDGPGLEKPIKTTIDVTGKSKEYRLTFKVGDEVVPEHTKKDGSFYEDDDEFY